MFLFEVLSQHLCLEMGQQQSEGSVSPSRDLNHAPSRYKPEPILLMSFCPSLMCLNLGVLRTSK
jgi:hypothetical protein